MNGFSVIMPTYNQCAFIRRAILSLFSQTYPTWELIIINDGCTDDTEMFLSDFLPDERIVCIKHESNQGLGKALNRGLAQAKYEHIAYLPSDDFYYENHLEEMKKAFETSADVVLVFSGVRYENNDSMFRFRYQKIKTKTIRQGYCLQLVQAAHKKTTDRWVERSEWVSEDLFKMFWNQLTGKGIFYPTRSITCHWTSHLHQRHKIMAEKYGFGGINYYRSYYRVKEPIKIKVNRLKYIDEEQLYAYCRKAIPPAKDSLKILLVGELAYNPERIYAFEEQGHQLYGLWIKQPRYTFSTVGSLPFGHVEDIPYDGNWKQKVKKIKPDIIYALLNECAIPLAYEVMRGVPEIPFVWHFKEGPSVSMNNGTWEQLVELYSRADGKIYLNPDVKNWYGQFIHDAGLSHILDGDLPKGNYFTNDFSPLLSDTDGAIHTVITGRIVGITPEDMASIASQNIHIHLYSESYHDRHNQENKIFQSVAPHHFHIHPNCPYIHWVKEFSRYDAGWLHLFKSENYGDLKKATWDDLNLPARINTLAAAGLPMIQWDNSQHLVVMQSHIKELDIGIFMKNFASLGAQLQNRTRMQELRNNVKLHRKKFCFDDHVTSLIDFFRQVIENKKLKTKN